MLGTLTYSAAIWSSCDRIIFELEILIEDCCVKLDSTVEQVTYAIPVGGGICRHGVSQALFGAGEAKSCRLKLIEIGAGAMPNKNPCAYPVNVQTTLHPSSIMTRYLRCQSEKDYAVGVVSSLEDCS